MYKKSADDRQPLIVQGWRSFFNPPFYLTLTMFPGIFYVTIRTKMYSRFHEKLNYTNIY